MRNELFVLLIKKLAPVMISFKLSLVDIKVFNVFGHSNEFVFHEHLDVELEVFVLSNAIINILVHRGYACLYLF